MSKLDKLVIKWFLGSTAVVDERTKSELGKLAIRTVFVFFMFELFFVFGSMVYLTNSNVISYENILYITMFIQILMTFIITYGFIYIPLAKKKLLRREISSEEKKQVTKEIKHSWVKLAPLLFLAYWIVDTMVNFGLNRFFENLFNLKQIISALIFTLIFSIGMYLYERKRVHVVKDDI